jgi:hypothetical protein
VVGDMADILGNRGTLEVAAAEVRREAAEGSVACRRVGEEAV